MLLGIGKLGAGFGRVGTAPVGTGLPSAFASGTLSFFGNAVDGETVTIGAIVYRFVAVPSDTFDVQIGSSASLSIQNLVAAVNIGQSAHPDVTASSGPGVMNVTADVAGVAGNSIVTDTTVTGASWGAATLQGGA
jgi:hypothetical protein